MADGKSAEGIDIAFRCGALPDDTVRLISIDGRERLSRLFEFDLVLSREAGPFSDDELDELLTAPCAIALGPKPGDIVHGLLESIELVDSSRDVAARYIARMVPSVWLLTLSRTCRVFQDQTVPQIVEAILSQYGLSNGDDFEILVDGSISREYVVQYQESDWDFIQRWLEHEGLFYWFEHGEETEKLIISDKNDKATPIEDPDVISYRERNNLGTDQVTLWDWNIRHKRVAARVGLVDYNYRTPHVPLFATEVVDDKRGFGSLITYGDHFKDNDAGKVLATRRAERIRSERVVLSGRTDCARFRVGHVFETENHQDPAHDKKYLILGLEHHVGLDADTQGSLRYTARFEAIPFDVQYRPERITPWPRCYGILHAHVEADGAGDYAQLDELGRYKVRLPFDKSDAKGAKASRWIRCAQHFSGAAHGSHFPLRKGAEVLLAHIDGDVDRPIIIGTVPNPHTLSPTTSANATQSVIQTASGIRIELEDLQS